MAKLTEAQRDCEHQRGFACGIAVACAIAYGSCGEQVAVEEILRATGLETRRKMKALGVDDYDIDILKPMFAQMRPWPRKRRSSVATPAGRLALQQEEGR